MKEDGAAGTWDDLGWSIVCDEQLELMSGVILLHLLGLFPSSAWIVRQDDVTVVGGRLDILDPEVARGDAAIGELGVLANRGRVAPSTADAKDSGRGAAVAFFLGSGTSGIRVEAQSPDESLFSESALPRGTDLAPGVPGFFMPLQSDVRVVPIAGDPDQALLRRCGTFKARCEGED